MILMLTFLNKLGFISQFSIVFNISVFDPDHFFFFTFIYLFSVALGLHCCLGLSLVVVSRCYCSPVCDFLIGLVSFVVKLRL